ncbi:hypothetical protein HMPREF3213_03560 [Heyndrickxia coagulans]|uniref:Uncharacterized protein n=1 Tax=Heyndrickxia coagulans TaxID=1398 RepID=A0A133KBI5_HEYCO|nr:hypothetical protein HMPREF3213_03560 [Heyndrickxia coagulans]
MIFRNDTGFSRSASHCQFLAAFRRLIDFSRDPLWFCCTFHAGCFFSSECEATMGGSCPPFRGGLCLLFWIFSPEPAGLNFTLVFLCPKAARSIIKMDAFSSHWYTDYKIRKER